MNRLSPFVLSVFFVVAGICPAFANGEHELVAVLSARVRYGLSRRPQMPDQPPNLILNNAHGSTDRHRSPTPLASHEKHPREVLDSDIGATTQITIHPDIKKVIDEQTEEISDLESRLKEVDARNDLLERSVETLTADLIELKGRIAHGDAASKHVAPDEDNGVQSHLNKSSSIDPRHVADGEKSSKSRSDSPVINTPAAGQIPPAPSTSLFGSDLPSGQPLSLSLLKPVGDGAGAEQAYRCTMFTGEDLHGAGWCQNCGPTRRKFGNGAGRLQIEYSSAVAPGSQVYPAWRWKDASGKWREPTDQNGDYIQPKDVDQLLNWVKSTGPQQMTTAIAATAVGGALKTNGKVRSALSLWSDHIGTDAEVNLRWDRTGLQSLSATKLFAGQPWTPLMVAGKFGHVTLTTTSTRMPGDLRELGFAYKTMDDGKFSIDLDAITVELPTQSPVKNGAYGAQQAYGTVDPISIGFYLYSFATALYQILNPQIDVGIGGCVAATAKMDGKDRLVVTFSECPSIHVAVWFRFDLEVQRVIISPSNVHIDFKPQPQNWIRIESRDFPVDDGSSERGTGSAERGATTSMSLHA